MSLPTAATIVRDAATEIGPSMLYCSNCRTGRNITPKQIESYLLTGWPNCCGRTMMLERANGCVQ